jgi:hypothetical protein
MIKNAKSRARTQTHIKIKKQQKVIKEYFIMV